MKTKTIPGSLTATAAAALLLGGCAANNADSGGAGVSTASEMGQCHGVNSCKGNSFCATASSVCATQNTCKGKGWLALTAQECQQRGGRFSDFAKNK